MVICFFAYWTSIRDNKYKEDFMKLDEQVESGIVREFTQEEIEAFKKKALEKKDRIIKSGKIKPGDDFTTQFFAMDIPVEPFTETSDGKLRVNPIDYNYVTYTESAMSKETFSDNEILFNDVFNNKFEFKKDNIFYGITSVGDKFADYMNDPGFEYVREQYINSFVPGVKSFDRRYSSFDGTELNSVIEQALLNREGSVLEPGLSLDENIVSSPIKREAISKYMNLKEKTSIFPLIGYLTLKPMYFHFLNKNTVGITAAYEPFPEEYNYFNEKNNYFTIFYPTSIEKIDKRTYVVNVTVEDPVDPIGATQIYNEIAGHFINTSKPPKEYSNHKEIPFMLGVKIHNKNDLDGELLQDLPYDIVNSKCHILNGNDWPYVGLYESTYQKPAWYPNDEAQVWVKSFFDELNIAIENNTEFSITNTIKQISTEHNKEYNTVENVIFSYFWYCIS